MFHSMSCFRNGHMWVKCHNEGSGRARDHLKDPRLQKTWEKMRDNRKMRKVCSCVCFFSSSRLHHLSLHKMLKALERWINTICPMVRPTKNGAPSKKNPRMKSSNQRNDMCRHVFIPTLSMHTGSLEAVLLGSELSSRQ